LVDEALCLTIQGDLPDPQFRGAPNARNERTQNNRGDEEGANFKAIGTLDNVDRGCVDKYQRYRAEADPLYWMSIPVRSPQFWPQQGILVKCLVHRFGSSLAERSSTTEYPSRGPSAGY
jgi:hypothetical protein